MPTSFTTIRIQVAQLIAILASSLILLTANSAAAQERVQLADGSTLTVFMVRPAQTTDDPSPPVDPDGWWAWQCFHLPGHFNLAWQRFRGTGLDGGGASFSQQPGLSWP